MCIRGLTSRLQFLSTQGHSLLPILSLLVSLLVSLPVNKVAAVESATLAELAIPLRITPVYSRVEIAAGATTTITIEVVSASSSDWLSAEADCGCVQAVIPENTRLAAGRNRLQVHVTGILPGLKTLSVRTTTGTATTTIQVVTPGFGEGAAIAAELQRQAIQSGGYLVVIVHDLLSETRNCGCSGGSLGGIDHLAALREVFPGARLVLTGAIDSTNTPVVGPALAEFGWELAPNDIVISRNPLAALELPGLFAVMNVGNSRIANQRVMTPLFNRGSIAVVLLVSPNHTILSQHLLPIDRTFAVESRTDFCRCHWKICTSNFCRSHRTGHA